jgi:hypothetical protein
MTSFTWNTPGYSGAANNTFSNGGRTVERTSLGASDNLSFASNETILTGTTVVFSCTFDALSSADAVIVGVRNASQAVGVGLYPGGSGGNSFGFESDGLAGYNNSFGGSGLGAFAAGDRLYAEVNRTANTIRFSRDNATWTSTYDISGLGSGAFTLMGTTYGVGDKITLVDVGAGGATAGSSRTLLGVGQ